MSAIGQWRTSSEASSMSFHDPCGIHGSIETHYSVHSTMRADRSLFFLYPLDYRSRRILAKAVEARCTLAGEQWLAVHGRLARPSHGWIAPGVVQAIVPNVCFASKAVMSRGWQMRA